MIVGDIKDKVNGIKFPLFFVLKYLVLKIWARFSKF